MRREANGSKDHVNIYAESSEISREIGHEGYYRLENKTSNI